MVDKGKRAIKGGQEKDGKEAGSNGRVVKERVGRERKGRYGEDVGSIREGSKG